MKAIGVVKIVEYVSFMSLPCNMHDALSVHASCTSLYVCMMPIHYLVHGFKLADTIYAHTTYCNEKKESFLYSCCYNFSAAKYSWFCTYIVFVHILLKCFFFKKHTKKKPCHTLLSWTFSYDSCIT